MNFLLRNLETHVGEAALLEGEQLLAADQVRPLQEVERHLWVTQVGAPGQGVEVEVKISPSRVLAATCECATFREQGTCGHFAAALLALRRRLTDRKVKKRKKRAASASRPAKLTTSLVLDHVDRDELVAFVKEYARTHRNFAITLKARFAGQVESIGTREKFDQLLDSTIKLARRPDRSISRRGLQKIVKVLLELREQLGEALSRQHLRDAFSIARSVVEKLPPILGKFTATTDELEVEVEHAFTVLQTIADSPPPPALRRELWNYALDQCHKLAYRKHGYDLHFFRLLLKLAVDPEQVDRIRTALAVQKERYEETLADPTPLLLIELQLLEEHRRQEAAAALLEQHLLRRGLLQYALDYALKKKQYARAKQLIRAAREKHPAPSSAEWLERYQRRIAEAEGDTATLFRLLEKQYLKHLDDQTLEKLRERHGGDWLAYLPELLEKVRALPPTEAQRLALARLLAESGDRDALLDFLRTSGSLDLCRRFDAYLLPEYEEAVLELYQQLLVAYIQNHLGPKSSRKIRQLLDHLNEAGMQELAARLVQEFRTNYPERHTLMEELALL